MDKKYAIILTAGMAAAYGLGELDIVDLPDAKASVREMRRIRDLVATVPRAEFAPVTQSQIAEEICDGVENRLDLTPGACTLAHIEGWCVRARHDITGDALDPIQVYGVGQRWVVVTDDE